MSSINQKTDILLKKFVFNKSYVNKNGNDDGSTPQYPYYQEAYGSKVSVASEQIWIQSSLLPKETNPLNYGLASQYKTLRSNPLDAVVSTDANRPILTIDGYNIIQRLDLEMLPIPGSTTAYKYKYAKGSAEWIADFGAVIDFKAYNIIPLSYADNNSLYEYELYQLKNVGSDGTWGTSYTLATKIPINSADDWYLDTDSLVLNFLAETPAYNSGASIFLRCYRYIGKVGVENLVVSGGGSNTSSGAWQVDAINFVEGVTSESQLNSALALGYDVYINTSFTDSNSVTYTVNRIYSHSGSAWVLKTLVDRDRYVVSSARNLTNISAINTQTGAVISGTTTATTKYIIEYWDGTSRSMGTNVGFVLSVPQPGWYIIINKDVDVYIYSGTAWNKKNLDMTYPTISNKDMVCAVTTNDGDFACATAMTNTPTYDSYVEITVNGKQVSLGNGWTGSTPFSANSLFVKTTANITSFSGNTITTTTVHNLLVSDSVIVRDTNGIHVCTVTSVPNATQVVLTVINPTGGYTLTGSVFWMYKHKTIANIETGDKLIWFGSIAEYQLDANDVISFSYVIS